MAATQNFATRRINFGHEAAEVIVGLRYVTAAAKRMDVDTDTIRAWAVQNGPVRVRGAESDRLIAVAEMFQAKYRAANAVARPATQPAVNGRCTECGASLNSAHNHIGGAMPTMCFDCA